MPRPLGSPNKAKKPNPAKHSVSARLTAEELALWRKAGGTRFLRVKLKEFQASQPPGPSG